MSAEPDLRIRHLSPAFRTFCGEGALDALPRELTRVGARRAVIICIPAVAAHAEAMGRVHEVLGERLVGQFDGVEEHSPLPSVERARAFLADHEADAVIAVGGGSSVVTARAATILLGEDRDVRQLCTRRESGRLVSPKLSAPKLPQWVVPSSPTTAYAKAGAAVLDPETGERLALYDPKSRAQGVVLDAGMALTAPPRLSWSAALNIFSMAVEGLQSRRVDPLADALLTHALRTVVTWLPQVLKDPDQAAPRLQLMLAAIMSGQGSDHSGGGLAQALSHAIGPRSSAPNGVVEALLLPHAMRFNANVVPDRLAAVAGYLGLADRSADGVIAEVERLLEVFEVPRRLQDIGVARESLAEVVAHAMDDWAITAGPRPPEEQDVRDLITGTW
ncbi:iron-containing alcohol dehydrogenase family protein [Streptomyces sp. NEAU-YJ-81]|uniref:iron-containing alcohol dehydrogenase family protein n=1 Tax=Streptomyces sp. NEAU-YJ-81 TaxID=2820288 RepID=UPI001ABC9835|nr:iron-containing alcohol dehydrogenase family protein [Streptomyces sp. NEAU-YJ-81]MBO3680430.1 iron-containing alcohol dehydrogenase [Streptomyces sp. NEAU-YJ-81]